MFNLFKKESFKRPESPKGEYLEQEYWTKERIGHTPKFPIIEIDYNHGGGTIEKYVEFKDIQFRWNHFIFEDHINETSPNYFLDSELSLFKIQFHTEGFNYPKFLKKIGRVEIVELLKKCELTNLTKYEEMLSAEEIFNKLLSEKIKYD